MGRQWFATKSKYLRMRQSPLHDLSSTARAPRSIFVVFRFMNYANCRFALHLEMLNLKQRKVSRGIDRDV